VVHPDPVTAIGLTGHRVLSACAEELIVAALRAELGRHLDGELGGVSALADGANTLFPHAVLAAGGALIVRSTSGSTGGSPPTRRPPPAIGTW
jgi:hypothetical protein